MRGKRVALRFTFVGALLGVWGFFTGWQDMAYLNWPVAECYSLLYHKLLSPLWTAQSNQ